MSFTQVFGGGVLEPVNVGYQEITLDSNLILNWPSLSLAVDDFVASINKVFPTGSGFTIKMPPANQVSTGADILWRNFGAHSFTVLDHDGGTIVSVSPGQAQLIYLTDNSTEAGVWDTVLFGVGSSSVDAGTLAGYGLMAIANTLNQSHPSIIAFSGPVTVDASFRAQLFVWEGGVGTLNLPALASTGDNFFLLVRNSGSGVLTVDPSGSETIDDETSIALQIGESCFICSAGVAWFTVGRGRSTQFAFTKLSKAVTTGTATLTTAEAANIIQEYTGVLVGNVTVVLPAVVQVYYMDNQTSGAFTLTFQSPTPGATFTLDQGFRAILVTDGVDVLGAQTVTSGVTNVVLAAGSVGAPSLSFTGDSNTGLYQPVADSVAITCGGTEILRASTTTILASKSLSFSSSAVATASRLNMGTTQEAETMALGFA